MQHWIEINIYMTPNGKKPFIDWLEKLDFVFRNRIKERLDRLKRGNMGDYKPIDNRLFELRFYFGAGYRIYSFKESESSVLLLCGGDKSSQKKDIKQARLYLTDYLAGEPWEK